MTAELDEEAKAAAAAAAAAGDDPNRTTEEEHPEEPGKEKPGDTSHQAENTEGLPGIQETEDGFEIHVGTSVYKGATREEVWTNMIEGIKAKDKSYEETARKARELETRAALRRGESGDDREVEPPPQPAPESAYVERIFKEQGLEPQMARFTDDDWKKHAEEKQLTDWQVGRLIQRVEVAAAQVTRELNEDSVVWINYSNLRENITPAVEALVAESGLPAEEFGDLYYEILRDAKYRTKYGTFNEAAIVAAISKEIIKKSAPAKKLDVEKKAEEERKRLELIRRNAGGGGGAGGRPSPGKKEPINIQEATTPALK